MATPSRSQRSSKWAWAPARSVSGLFFQVAMNCSGVMARRAAGKGCSVAMPMELGKWRAAAGRRQRGCFRLAWRLAVSDPSAP